MNLPFFLVSRFVAGETRTQALDVAKEIATHDFRVAMDRLGEHETNEEKAVAATDHYIDLLETIGGLPDALSTNIELSIKLSMMGQIIDPSLCRENLLRLLHEARRHDVFVQLDMEGSDLTQSTLDLFEDAYDAYPEHVGPVLQAALKRTSRDVERMCELDARVRLCKGAYKEPPEIAYTDRDVIREKFMIYAKKLITRTAYPGIATHDYKLLNATKTFIREEDLGPDSFEFQMLYGIRRDTQRELRDDGYNVLVYLPYGRDWFPYLLRRVRERKENAWFVLKHLFTR